MDLKCLPKASSAGLRIVLALFAAVVLWTAFDGPACAKSIAEIEESLTHGPERVHFLYGAIILAILMVGVGAFIYEKRWEAKLAEEVIEKTESLRSSEERYRSLVENAKDMIYSLDKEGRIISANSYAANRFANASVMRSKAESIEGRDFFQLCFWDKLSPAVLQKAFNTAELQALEHTGKIGDKDCWFSTHLIPIKDGSGAVKAVLGISRDITEQKEIVHRMENTEKLASLGLLAAGVAHEINNPIAIIMGFSEMVLERYSPGEEMHDVLKRIMNQCRICEKVVSQLLSFSRTSDGAEDITDVNREIEDIIHVVGNTLLMKKIKLVVSVESGLPKIKADPKQIQQVFVNLINNAIAAMKGGGRLTVSTRFDEAGRLVRISFEDTGCGILRENRTKIFDPFFTTKKTGEGTGLGLTVSYNIMTSYGGTITFSSRTEEEPGDQKGTIFTVSLPAFD
ncbi:MAG: ATP-binding protein [Pseudomonadota bacterium]